MEKTAMKWQTVTRGESMCMYVAAQLHTLTLQSVTLLSKSGNEQLGGTASSIFFSNKLSERERESKF